MALTREERELLLRDHEALGREVVLAKMLQNPARITWVVLGINVALFLGAWVYGDRVIRNQLGISTAMMNVGQLAFLTGMKLPLQVGELGQWWRLLTSAFVHMDWSHMLFNGYGLYVMGPLVERFYGKSRWVVIYGVSALLSGLASYLLSDTMSGGASGAIYGLVGAVLVFGYKYRKDLPERVSHALTRGMMPWVVFGIGIGFLDIMPMDNAAHIGGLVTGGVVAGLMRSEVVAPARSRWSERLMAASALGLCALTVASFVFWGGELRRCTGSRAEFIGCYEHVSRGQESLRPVFEGTYRRAPR